MTAAAMMSRFVLLAVTNVAIAIAALGRIEHLNSTI